jgi:trk system potassium uptake protein
MYIIVVGGGKVGYYLTRTLAAEGHEVTLVEKDRRRLARLTESLGEIVTWGDGCEYRVMQALGMNRANCVVAVTGDDEDNLVICQMAKWRFGVERTISRVNDPKNEEIFSTLGVDQTLSSTRLVYSLIQQEVDVGEMVLLSAMKQGKIEVVSVELTSDSPVVGKALKDIMLPGEIVISAIIREEDIVLPSATTQFLNGDIVIALAHPGEQAALRDALMGSAGKALSNPANKEVGKQ